MRCVNCGCITGDFCPNCEPEAYTFEHDFQGLPDNISPMFVYNLKMQLKKRGDHEELHQ